MDVRRNSYFLKNVHSFIQSCVLPVSPTSSQSLYLSCDARREMKLSSSTTFFWKFIFTGLWLGFPLFGVGQAFWRWLVLSQPFSFNANPLGIVLLVAGIGFVWWMLASLKSVSLEGNFLLVSNYFRKAEIPLSEINHLDAPENSSHRRIFISFRSPTEFGDVIVFMPQLFQAKETFENLKRRVENIQ